MGQRRVINDSGRDVHRQDYLGEATIVNYYGYKVFQVIMSFTVGIVALPEFVPAGVIDFPYYPGLGVRIRIATVLVEFLILQLFVPIEERS